MIPKKLYSLRDKHAGIKPDRVKVAKGKKVAKKSTARKVVDKIKNVIDKKK